MSISLIDENLKLYTSNDISTGEKFTQRSDNVQLVERPDGSRICHHSDGTRFTKFQNMTRIEHPAYGSVLFCSKDSVALTLPTNITIIISPNGVQVNDKENEIQLQNYSWKLNNLSRDDIELQLEQSEKKDRLICIKNDGSGYEFTNWSDSILENVGVSEMGFGDHTNFSVVDLETNVDEKYNRQYLWQSGYAYQEESIIPKGLRISSSGGGKYAMVVEPSVLKLRQQNMTTRKYRVVILKIR